MIKPQIPKSKRTVGLYVHCKECKRKSASYLKPTETCSHPTEKLSYRAIFTIPGTNSIKSKILDTTDINEAIKLTLDFESQLKKSDYKTELKVDSRLPVDLIGCMVMYMDYLENKNVFDHQKKLRSEQHIKSISRYLGRFIESLKDAGKNPKSILIRHIDDEHVDIFYRYLNNLDKCGNRTFNRHMDTVSEMFNYLIDEKKYKLSNYFRAKNVRRKRTVSQIETITIDEFKALLQSIKPENSIEELSTGEKKYHYYEWLNDALELALYTGLRRDSITMLRFSDIIEVDGKPFIIQTEDYKYNRRNNLVLPEEKKYIYVPVILDLHLMLQKLRYEKYKGQNRYLIAPSSTRKRETLKDDLSKAFTHYWKQVNSEKNIQFRNLRKTYITRLNNYTNGQADSITGHAGQEVIMKHYQNPKVISNVIEGFRMIS